MEVAYIHPDIKRRISELPAPVKARVLQLIGLLEVHEYHLSMPYSKKIERGLFELRVMGHQHVRIFYTFYQEKAVLLHVVSKKARRLPARDLETARQRISWLR